MKIVISTNNEGLNVSDKAILWLRERGYQPAIDQQLESEYKLELAVWRTLIGEVVPTPHTVTGSMMQYRYKAPLNGSNRTDALLVECVETLGAEFGRGTAGHVVIEVPDDLQFTIKSPYYGGEYIVENYRVWDANGITEDYDDYESD